MAIDKSSSPPTTSRKERLWRIIFEADTPAGKWFDIVLLWCIGLSVLAPMLETVDTIDARWAHELDMAEWFFTVIFTAEYILRLWISRKPMRYATSFFGIVDFLACLPQYLAVVFGAAHGFAVVRVLRLLRVFRILKMVHHLRGASTLLRGLRRAQAKITVFFSAVFILCTIAGTLLYFVEGAEPQTQFTSIPISIYYAVVSITTVGYGDITVTTDWGRFLTSLMILSGFAIIAVPTGIITAELADHKKTDHENEHTTGACPTCDAGGHARDASYCRICGHHLGEALPQEEKPKPS